MMREIKNLIKIFFYYLKYILYILKIQKKGQSEVYEIMQLAHRLEKGLVNQNPKPMWGWEKAERLCFLLSTNKESISYETGLSVINKYIENKHRIPTEKKIADKLKNKYNIQDSSTPGGAYILSKPLLSSNDKRIFENIIKSRHSTRNFDTKDLDMSKVDEAISLALYCPSACNRQPYNIYVVSDEKRKHIGVKDESAASIYVTGVIDAYTMAEMLDWIVSPSIFVGYLTLSLHIQGIGSCIYRKDLVCDTEYNKQVKKLCDIPDNEQIILEIRIGNYPERVNVAVSNRFSFKQIIHYI